MTSFHCPCTCCTDINHLPSKDLEARPKVHSCTPWYLLFRFISHLFCRLLRILRIIFHISPRSASRHHSHHHPYKPICMSVHLCILVESLLALFVGTLSLVDVPLSQRYLSSSYFKLGLGDKVAAKLRGYEVPQSSVHVMRFCSPLMLSLHILPTLEPRYPTNVSDAD